MHPPYALSLASKIVEVATNERLDLIHVHYAVPHATSAYLAGQILGAKRVPIITTLHGTDITLVGNDRSYLPITRFSTLASDGITTPSQYLKDATYRELDVPTSHPIEVIPNFVDTEVFRPKPSDGTLSQLWRRLTRSGCSRVEPLICHVSNFRPVKRTSDLVHILKRVRQEVPAHLILIGDGPDRSDVELLARSEGMHQHICFLGKLESFVDILQECRAFLLPSESESFGLAALEALSCGVPVVASNIHGIPEVVSDGECGFLAPVGDVAQMAEFTLRLLKDDNLQRKFAKAARMRAEEHFSQGALATAYEQYYRRILARK